MGNDDDYKFLRIEDALLSVNQKVSLIGVILEFGVPRQSNGTDCFISLKIIDEGHQGPGLAVNVFAESMEKLPCVNSSGDIILLTNIVIKTHGKNVYALFNKKFSTFALFEGKYGKDFIPYQVSRKYFYRDKDKKFVDGLRKWMVDVRLDIGKKESVLLRELTQGVRVDLVCKILYVCEVSRDEWMAFIWDGSDAPPLTIETRLDDEKEHMLPLHLESLPLPRDVLCSFPTVGTILRVTADGGNKDLRLLNIGKWAKFLNIVTEVHAGLWRGVLMPVTKILYIPDEDTIVSQRQRSHDERASTKWGRMPFSCFDWPSHVTEIDYEDKPFVTLMDILTCSKAVAKFKSVVRVVAIYPWQAKDFRSPEGIYRIRLTLEDSTARIHAFVYAEDGEKFFEDYPSIDVLKNKRNNLLGIDESGDEKDIEDAPRNPPWVQCCLKSYYLEESDVWGSRNYRIFGTKVKSGSLKRTVSYVDKN